MQFFHNARTVQFGAVQYSTVLRSNATQPGTKDQKLMLLGLPPGGLPTETVLRQAWKSTAKLDRPSPITVTSE